MTHQHFTWQAILFARMVLTGLFFLAFCLYKKEPLLAPLRKEPWLMLKFTVLGMFVMQVPFVKAIYYSNAATATVLQYLMLNHPAGHVPVESEAGTPAAGSGGRGTGHPGYGPDRYPGRGGRPGRFAGNPVLGHPGEPLAWPGTPCMRRNCSSATAAS